MAKKQAKKSAKKAAKKTRKVAAVRKDRKPAKKAATKNARSVAKKKPMPMAKAAKKTVKYESEESKLMKLFEDELKDIYWAEKALTKALPKMAKKATSPDLVEAIQNHLEETEEQIRKVEQVFELLGKKAQAKKCEAMDGLLKEGEEIMKDTEKGSMRDAGIISAAQKVEHYEIASYGTLKTFALTLGHDEAADLLGEILDQEKNADLTLTGIAEAGINVKASREEEGEEEEDEKADMTSIKQEKLEKELEHELVDAVEDESGEADDEDNNTESDEE